MGLVAPQLRASAASNHAAKGLQDNAIHPYYPRVVARPTACARWALDFAFLAEAGM
jgi:hypothetical protein